MNDPEPIYDRIRAWADGSLPPAEAARLQADLAADPDLAAAARAYLEVHRATEVPAGPAPTSRLTLADVLEERSKAGEGPARVPARRWGTRWALAAAAVALLGIATLLATRPGGGAGAGAEPAAGPVPVALAAIPLSAPPAPPPPALLGSWRPVEGDSVRWLDSADEAQAVARLTNRPVLVYAMHPTCPLCREMERGTLRASAVTDAAARFVPLRIDVSRLPAAEARRMLESGWPHFAVEDAEGQVIEAFGGMHEAADFRRRLDEAWEARPPGREVVEWAAAGETARDQDRALRARDALLAARDLAPADPERARKDLAAAAAGLKGTRYAEDLALVLGRWPTGGRFPSLVEAPR